MTDRNRLSILELGFHAPDGRTEQPVVGVATKVWTGGRVRRTDTYVFSNIASSGSCLWWNVCEFLNRLSVPLV